MNTLIIYFVMGIMVWFCDIWVTEKKKGWIIIVPLGCLIVLFLMLIYAIS